MEEIDIRCNLPLLSIESILKHRTHLRILRIQDPSGWWDGNRSYGRVLYRALSITDLTRLRDSCPRLKDISLELVVNEHNVSLLPGPQFYALILPNNFLFRSTTSSPSSRRSVASNTSNLTWRASAQKTPKLAISSRPKFSLLALCLPSSVSR